MDAVLLTWRWQNILSIWIMIGALILASIVATQIVRKVKANGS